MIDVSYISSPEITWAWNKWKMLKYIAKLFLCWLMELCVMLCDFWNEFHLRNAFIFQLRIENSFWLESLSSKLEFSWKSKKNNMYMFIYLNENHLYTWVYTKIPCLKVQWLINWKPSCHHHKPRKIHCNPIF